MSTCLVTGGAGYVGSHLADAWIAGELATAMNGAGFRDIIVVSDRGVDLLGVK